MVNSLCPTHVTAGRRARANALALLVAGMFLIGCALPKSPPEIVSDQYRGPACSLVTLHQSHALRVSFPSPGWKVQLDQERRGLHRHDVYVTFERPSPLHVYTTHETRQDVLTSIPATRSVRVLVREVEPGRSTGPYRVAAQSDVTTPSR